MIEKSKTKEEILDRIRQGLKKAEFKKFPSTDLKSSDVFHTPDKPLIEIFEEELVKISGVFYYCTDPNDLVDKLKKIHDEYNLSICYSPDLSLTSFVKQAEIQYTAKFENEINIKSGISTCEFLIARFGSVMVSSALAGARRIFSFPEIHVVVAYENQLVMELEEALEGIQLKYKDELPSQITNIAGPSRTADIEKTLILGAHGPKKLIVLLLKKE